MSVASAPEGARRLLATKLHAPRRRRQLVARRRLTDRLADLDRPVLTLVSAPAGFGKTTLLGDWFESAQRPGESVAAWLSVDAGDNDPARFAAYLVASLRSVLPVDAADEALDAGEPIDVVVTVLMEDLQRSDLDVTLVVDDYHLIESVEIHDAIAFLVDRAPANFTLVIATRSDPPLPLARWRVRGDLLELRAADLRFTTDETGAYLRDSMGVALSRDHVDALETRTEGWIAALQLAALSLQGREDVAAFVETFTGDDRFVLDYLAEEVLERQTESVRRFLLETSVLERMNGSLCDAVTGASGSKATLEQLDRANLFLVPLDDRRQWYRYHHLFADVLRARLLDEDPNRARLLHRRASDWFGTQQEPSDAISHAMAAEDIDRAAELIELAAPAMRQSRQDGTLRRWLEALPSDVFADRPVLAMGLVAARMATGDTTGVGALLDLLESMLDRPERQLVVFDHDFHHRLAAQVAVQRAGLALLARDIDGTLAYASRALELVDPTDAYRRGSATALIALAHWTAGDLDRAVERYAEAIDDFIAVGHLADMLGISLALGDIQMVQGKLSDAARTFERGLRWTAETPALRGAADMHVGLSEVFIERNQLDRAAAHLDKSVELGELAGLPQHRYRRRVVMARLRRALGDTDAALELIDDATPYYDTDYSPPVRPIDAMRVRVLLARGDLEAARTWVSSVGLTVHDELSYVREYEHNTLARVLIATAAATRNPGDLDDALALLHRLLAAAVEGGRSGSVIDLLILQATASQARGDTEPALDALREALRLSEPEGHIRLFLHAGPAVRSLVRVAASGDDATPHARRVLAALEPAVPGAVEVPTKLHPRLVEDLSPRELEVLRLLRSDLSGPEIARELHVSLNTFRSHTKSIFTKLGATNRREALSRAAAYGI